jgi:multidrug resistance protein
VTQTKLYPWTALTLLTALNLLNYIDRSVLFAVQPLVQSEFHLTNTQVGYLTSAFLGFYMVAAPFTGPLADRYSRKKIIILGAIFWSALTLLTAVTHTYWELLVRHTLVGVGEATFVTIAPTFVADLFPENKRGRIFGVFYLAIPVGTAAGYLLGGKLGPHFGWRFPFYIAAFPGFLLALSLLFVPEPPRGQFDSLKETPRPTTFIEYLRRVLGLIHNPAFWVVTLGMAAGTFSLGGIQVWMPTFLSRVRGYSLESANLTFGKIVVVDGILASLAGGWLGDRLLPRMKSSYYFVSALSMGLGVPVMIVGLFSKGRLMLPAIAVAAFLLLLNTSPLNTALVNSVGAHIRATAIAVNIFIFHLLGDVPSPTLMGYVADRRSLQAAFILPVVAMAVSSAILFYGMRFAPEVRVNNEPGSLGGQPG